MAIVVVRTVVDVGVCVHAAGAIAPASTSTTPITTSRAVAVVAMPVRWQTRQRGGIKLMSLRVPVKLFHSRQGQLHLHHPAALEIVPTRDKPWRPATSRRVELVILILVLPTATAQLIRLAGRRAQPRRCIEKLRAASAAMTLLRVKAPWRSGPGVGWPSCAVGYGWKAADWRVGAAGRARSPWTTLLLLGGVPCIFAWDSGSWSVVIRGADGRASISGSASLRRTGFYWARGEASPWNDTLLGAIQSDAEGPAIVVLVEKAHKLTSTEAQLIWECGLEIQLNTVHSRLGRSAVCGNLCCAY